jgi:hypothetical protein
MWLARTIAAGLLIGLTGVSWIAWRAIRAEQEQTRLRAAAEQLRAVADTARASERALREQAQRDELAALQKAYALDMVVAQAKLQNNNPGRALELLNRQRPQPGQRDLRGWEWRYLWLQCQSDPHVVLDDGSEFANLPSAPVGAFRDGSIWSLAVSRDGRIAAAGYRYEGRVAVWDLVTQKKIVQLKSGTGSVRVAISPHDSLLAFTVTTGPRNLGRSTLRFYDVRTGQIRAGAWEFAGECMGLAFSADGRTLAAATGGSDSRIILWQVSDNTNVASQAVGSWDFGGGVAGTPFAATTDLSLVVVGPGTEIKLFDMLRREERWTAIAADESVKALALSPDGKLLASGAGFQESAIRLWDVASGREIRRLEGHGVWVGAMEFFPDGKTLVSISADRSIRLWDLGRPGRGRSADCNMRFPPGWFSLTSDTAISGLTT